MIGMVYDKDTPAFDTIKHHYASLMLPVAPIPVLWRSLFIKNHANPASHETMHTGLNRIRLRLVVAGPHCRGGYHTSQQYTVCMGSAPTVPYIYVCG